MTLLGVVLFFGESLIAQTNNSISKTNPVLVYSPAWNQSNGHPAVVAFHDWADRYLVQSGGSARAQMLSKGVQLAKARRAVFAEMVKTNPAAVLELTVPSSIRQQLPAEVAAELENRVSGIGDFSVLAAVSAPGGPPVEPVQRFVRLNGHSFRAYVYGRRTGETTKRGVPLHGVAIGNILALHEAALREIEPGESTGTNGLTLDLSVPGRQSTGAPAVAAEVGGRLYRFASREQLRRAETLLEATEAGIGPLPAHRASDVLQPDSLSLAGNAESPAPLAPSSWTQGKKNVIYIRVDFSDLAGDPQGLTAAAVQNFADTQISPFYLASSYGLTSLTNTVTPVYRMPHTAAYYATNADVSQLLADATTAAGAGYNVASFDRVIVFFSSMTYLPNSGINWGGLATVGGPDVWVNGALNFAIVAHELGHTYGLFHANLWQVNDGNPVSDGGTSVEYDDDFDTMGGNYANDSRTDFNPWFKSMLSWIPSAQTRTVTTNATVRLFRFDSTSATGTVAVVVAKDGSHNYWIGYRRNFTDNPSSQNGAYIVRGYTFNRQSDLVDTATPGFNDKDAALGVGSTLIDPGASLSIATLAEGGTAPHEYLDIQIHFGTALPAIYAQPRSLILTSGQIAPFSVLASGIPLPACRWQRKASGTATWTNLIDNAVYTGSHSPTLTVTGTTQLMDGDLFQCILTNTVGSVTTAPPALLNVIAVGVSTLAGHAGTFGSSDGTGGAANFKLPTSVVADGLGNVYVADRNNDAIRKITPQGVVTTIAGLASTPGYVDATNNDSRFNFCVGIAMDSAGNLYVTDTGNSVIRKITPVGTNWVVTTIAGQPGGYGFANGIGTNAQFATPLGIAVDPLTNLFVADRNNALVRKLTRSGTNWVVSTYASGFLDPQFVAVDRWGHVFVTDGNAHAIDRVYSNGQAYTWAGNGTSGSQDGTGTAARFFEPAGIAADILGNIYVADSDNGTIRKITQNAVVTTPVGQAGVGGATDGPLTNASFGSPQGIATDTSGNLYVADYANQTIRKIVIGPPTTLPRFDGPVIDNGTFRFVLDGPVGSNYFLLASSDMANWLSLSTNVVPTGGWLTIQDAITNQARRFYRASTQPPTGPGH
jgi:M6 family metalloprotease-like protein